ncbi:MAG: ATP-grasp domain-containing protein [Bacteriovoracaceae bacterium]
MLNSTIGFLGAGQLAKMSALAAFNYGHRTAFYSDRATKEPCSYLSPNISFGSFEDYPKLEIFAYNCDIVTLENEFISPDILKLLELKTGKKVFPSFATFSQINTKLNQKNTFSQFGIPVVPYFVIKDINGIENNNDFKNFVEKYSYPFVMKSSFGGYDGYGNASIKSFDDLKNSFTKLSKNGLSEVFLEAFIPFEKELAVTVAQNSFETVVYPCVETIQKNHICELVIAPAIIDFDLAKKVQAYAEMAMKKLKAIGVFSFEFFLTKNGEIYLNELAPRPHNSAHYTIEACYSSQFDNHIRAIMDYPARQSQNDFPHAIILEIYRYN